MKIAMPYQDGVLLEHFGRAKEFIIYNVSDLDPVTSEVIAPEDLSHAAVARALKEHGVDVVLCGSIGEHARQAVEGEHMLVFSGITGAADDVLERFLQGNLEAVDGDFAAGGGCGGCGGGCASGGCAGCSGCGGGAEREPYVETRTFTDIVTLTRENFQTEVLDDPGLILIDFWAEWSRPPLRSSTARSRRSSSAASTLTSRASWRRCSASSPSRRSPSCRTATRSPARSVCAARKRSRPCLMAASEGRR